MAARNRCHFCVALHTARLLSLGGSAELVAALRSESPLPVPRLEAVRRFALTALATAGGVPAVDLDAFLAAGYTPQQALEVMLGIGPTRCRRSRTGSSTHPCIRASPSATGRRPDSPARLRWAHASPSVGPPTHAFVSVTTVVSLTDTLVL